MIRDTGVKSEKVNGLRLGHDPTIVTMIKLCFQLRGRPSLNPSLKDLRPGPLQASVETRVQRRQRRSRADWVNVGGVWRAGRRRLSEAHLLIST